MFKQTENVVIVEACRTAIGTFGGSLSNQPAAKLGAGVISHLLNSKKCKADEVDQVILGQVLTAGDGQNTARQASIGAGLKKETPAMLINQVCGSGLRAVCLGAQQIITNESKVVIAGGQECMSQAKHCVDVRNGHKMGNVSLVDTMIKDGLWDAFNDYHMGQTAENIAKKYDITRKEQDEFAFNSQQRAGNAIKQGCFAEEIISYLVKSKKEEKIFEIDEFVRHNIKLEKLNNLRPAFLKNGTVTAGNASGLNDGAAGVLLMAESKAKKLGIKSLGKIVSWASVGVSPELMGLGPVPASKLALQRAGWNINDLDLIESNEAFAVQAIAVNREMGWNTEKVNVCGGAIALGHPIGASGARILTTLIHSLNRLELNKGLATLCVGGGMGVAMCIERVV